MSDMVTVEKKDKEIFYNKIIFDNYEYILALARRKTEDNEEAFDIVQETFCEAWRSIEQLRNHPEVRGWLVDTAKNKMLHTQRDINKQNAILCVLKKTRSGDEFYYDEELTDFLSELKPEDADVLSLFYKKQMSVAEIAETLDIRETAVKMRLSRARNRLANAVKEKKFFKNFLFMCYLLSFLGNL